MTNNTLFAEYWATVQNLMEQSLHHNERVIAHLAPRIAASIADGGMLHLFGSGHSSIIAAEVVNRAGGLVPVNRISDPTSGWAEVVNGYGTQLFTRYRKIFQAHSGEFVIVISNSGRNPSPIDLALAAKDAGLSVIALTALDASTASTSNHPSGKRLFEVADHVLDNRSLPGDAAVPLPDSKTKVGPTSTFTGALLLNKLILDVTEQLIQRGGDLPILTSANVDGGRQANEILYQRYRDRLSNTI